MSLGFARRATPWPSLALSPGHPLRLVARVDLRSTSCGPWTSLGSKTAHRPAHAAVGDGVGLERVGVARGVEVDVVLFVCVAAGRNLGLADGLAVVTAVDDAVHWRAPPAAAVERACIASKPVIAHPPAVRAVIVRAVAVAVRVELVRIRSGAVGKIAVAVAAVAPAGLRHDATEPTLPAAVDRSVEVGGLDALGGARTGKGAGASAICRQDGLGGRVVVVADVRAVGLQVVGPRWPSVIAALLRGPVWTWAPSVAVAAGGGGGGWRGGDGRRRSSRGGRRWSSRRRGDGRLALRA
mmetsp:Transcript_48979/g.158672  ORF Transcript_48979/g.158672 Transcript_48979/m.158672 type:complete len:296 (-) Transcript_48979:592-1479(-)